MAVPSCTGAGWLLLGSRTFQPDVRLVPACAWKSSGDLTCQKKVTLKSPDSVGGVVLNAVWL